MRTVIVRASDISDKLSDRLVREYAEGRAKASGEDVETLYRPMAAWEASADRLLGEGFFHRIEELTDCAGWPWINADGVFARRIQDGDEVRVEYRE
jgi:hypothetical protein